MNQGSNSPSSTYDQSTLACTIPLQYGVRIFSTVLTLGWGSARPKKICATCIRDRWKMMSTC
ncbi:hypothetical protein LX36DRAFT_656829 [Colletotrichum falcatum]|nr:hypothetical protein LX36DRAFT_656829 [Colletotrichum falcatum]